MRPDRPFVEAADFDPKRSLRLPRERLGCAQFVRIEIDVGVEVSKFAHPTKIVRLRRRSRAERAGLPAGSLRGSVGEPAACADKVDERAAFLVACNRTLRLR